MKKILFLFLSLFTAQTAAAIELFGVNITNADAELFRKAITARGIQPANNRVTGVFDSYDVKSLFPGAIELYIAQDQDTGKLAFVEYCIAPNHRMRIHEVLTNRYGGALEKPGRFLSDSASVWKQNGVEITLTQYPRHACMSLTYAVVDRLNALHQRYASQTNNSLYPEFAL
ncbi:MAG: hypothetical protein HWE20_16620 [Gammaproteobacteria bacterium]|nr:hypothetical protein [Gammaproteobacteria bacterium]